MQRNHNLMATPTPMATPGFSLGETPTREVYGVQTPGMILLSFILLIIQSFIHSFDHSIIHSFIYSLSHSLSHSLTHSFIHSLNKP